MKKLLLIFTLFLITLFFSLCYPKNNVVNIPDRTLKSSILNELGFSNSAEIGKKILEIHKKGEICLNKILESYEMEELIREYEENLNRTVYSYELDDIKEIKIAAHIMNLKEQDKVSSRVDLTGIEYCRNIEKLEIFSLEVLNWSRLLSLNELNELKLIYSKNIDFSVIDKMNNLKKLSVNLLPVDKPINISLPPNIEQLEIEFCKNVITDLTFLLSIIENGKLESVSIEYNYIDLKPGKPNREVIDKLIKAGVKVYYEKGNITENTDPSYIRRYLPPNFLD
jgi:hypothetical protein